MEEHTWQNVGGVTTTETWMGGNESHVLPCSEEREHKKQVADEWEETRHCYSTVQLLLGLSASKGTKHTQIEDCQHASSVDSQKQWYSHSTAHRPTTSSQSVCSHTVFWRGLQYHFLLAHRNKEWWTAMQQSELPWEQTPKKKKKKAFSTHSRCCTQGRTHRNVSTPRQAFLNHSGGRRSESKQTKKICVMFSA